MAKKNLIKRRKSQRGVALIFSLGILGLMVVLGLTFASLSFTEQKAASSSTGRYAAKILAKSAVNQALMVLESNPDLKVKQLITKDTQSANANQSYDFLWKLITKHRDVAGFEKMYKHIGNRVILGNDSPYWQYVLCQDNDGNDEISGRFAYIAYKPIGLLDPVASVQTPFEGTGSAPVRYGIKPDELDVSVLNNVKVGTDPSGNTVVGTADGNSISTSDIQTLGQSNEALLNSTGSNAAVTINTPAELYSKFTVANRDKLTHEAAYSALGDALTSSWFMVPRPLPNKEKFTYNGKEYHRFNLNRTPEEWADLRVEDLQSESNLVEFSEETDWKTVLGDKIDGTEVDTAAEFRAVANATRAIPWFFGDDDDKKQMAANFLAYFSPMPENETELKDRQYWGISGSVFENPTYTANMRTPYLNEVLLDFSLEMAVTKDELTDADNNVVTGIPANATGTFTRTVEISLTPVLKVDFEIADLYKTFGDMIKFKLDIWNDLNFFTSAEPAGTGSSYKPPHNGTISISQPLTVEISPGDFEREKDTFPKYSMIASWSGSGCVFEKKFTMTYAEGTMTNGGSFTYNEALTESNVKSLKVRLSADFGNGNYIPIDYAYLLNENAPTPLGDFTEKKDSEDNVYISPFHVEVNNTDTIANQDQQRHVVLHFKAKDPAANLKAEDWVWTNKDALTKLNDSAARPDEIVNNFGKINWTTSDQPASGYFPDTFALDDDMDYENAAENFESETGYGGKVSTSYIRGRHKKGSTVTEKIQSPWEIGFIHRGRPFQTLNVKKFKKADPETSGEYKDGDANIFDYLKFSPDVSEIENEEKDSIRGQINLNDITSDKDYTSDPSVFNNVTINDGNLHAAKALFSNIKLGWKLPSDNDKFDPDTGTKLTNEQIEELVIKLAKVNMAYERLDSRAQMLWPGNGTGGKIDEITREFYDYITAGGNDAEKEELIGKIMMLTSAESMAESPGEFVILVGIAQSLKINKNAVSDRDWLQNGEFSIDFRNYKSNAGNAPLYEKAMLETGYGYRDLDTRGNVDFVRFRKLPDLQEVDPAVSDRGKKFYPGYDSILSTQKVVAWLRKKTDASGKVEWIVERLDYVD